MLGRGVKAQAKLEYGTRVYEEAPLVDASGTAFVAVPDIL
jgi:hypothetical protein